MSKKMTKIFKSYEDFLNRPDKNVNGVSPEFSEKNPDWEEDNATNKGCWNCYSCKSCESCYSCKSCKSCYFCNFCYYNTKYLMEE